MTKRTRQAAAKRLRKAWAAMNDKGAHWVRGAFVGKTEDGEVAYCMVGGIRHVTPGVPAEPDAEPGKEAKRFEDKVYTSSVVALADTIAAGLARNNHRRVFYERAKAEAENPSKVREDTVESALLHGWWGSSGQVKFTTREEVEAFFAEERKHTVVRAAEDVIIYANDRRGTTWSKVSKWLEGAVEALESA